MKRCVMLVVDDAIRFVSEKSSSTKPELEKEKHKVDDAVTVDKKRDNNNDVQRPKEEDKQQQSTATPLVLAQQALSLYDIAPGRLRLRL